MRMREISEVERKTAEALGALLESAPLGKRFDLSEEWRFVLSGLSFFIPEVLGEVRCDAGRYTIDAIYPARVTKNRARGIELVGLVCFVNDQTVSPLHLKMQVAETHDFISWFELRLGETDKTGGMRREKYRHSGIEKNMLHVWKRAASMDWFIHVAYGTPS
jgi:hypothetical protein